VRRADGEHRVEVSMYDKEDNVRTEAMTRRACVTYLSSVNVANIFYVEGYIVSRPMKPVGFTSKIPSRQKNKTTLYSPQSRTGANFDRAWLMGCPIILQITLCSIRLVHFADMKVRVLELGIA
jgi:hypothetical protein